MTQDEVQQAGQAGRRYALNEAVGIVTFGDATHAEFFDAFFDPIDGDEMPDAPVIELRLLRPADHVAALATSVEGGAIQIVADGGVTWMWSTGASTEMLVLIGRRLLRQLWFDRRLRSSAVIVIHASAVYDDDMVIAFVGDRYSGKTTLLIDSVRSMGMSILTNDNLLVYRAADELMLTCTPTHVRVRGDVVERYNEFLRSRMTDVANLEELDRYARNPAEFGDDLALRVTFSALGRPCFPTLRLADRRLLIVDTRFATDGEACRADLVAGANLESFVASNLKPLHEVRGFLYGSPPYLVDPGELSGREKLIAAVAEAAHHACYRHDGTVAALFEVIGVAGGRR